jgi:hypothetical protein
MQEKGDTRRRAMIRMVQELLVIPAFFLSMDRVQEVREVLATTALLCIIS